MRLSDAIVLGSTLRPQCRNNFFSPVDGMLGSCALGAAAEAAGLALRCGPGITHEDIYGEWPFLLLLGGTCPVCSRSGPLSSLVFCLSDEHHWTREQIAEFIATVEPPEAPFAAETPTLERAQTRDQRDGAVAQADAAPIFKH